MIYTLDTNVVVDALRQPLDLDRLKAFLSWALPSTVLSSIVAAELTAGARTDKARRVLDDVFLEPFERRGRVIAPFHRGVASYRYRVRRELSAFQFRLYPFCADLDRSIALTGACAP